MADTMNILIAGAGVAGPAFALLLSQAGHKCTIVERAPEFRASGQQIDVSGEGLKVIKLMSVDEAIRSCRVEDNGLKFVDAADHAVASFPVDKTGGSESFVKEIEIMRADLVRIFYERTQEKVQYIFDDYITGLTQDETGVTVNFVKAEKQRFDVVVAADGLKSRTRDVVFDSSNTEIVRLNMYASFLNVPWQDSDGSWSRWYNAPGGRCVSLRPNMKNQTTSAYLCQVTEASTDISGMGKEGQKQRLLEIFKDAGWETKRVLDEIESNDADFYLQEVAQAKSKSWSIGRAVLLGDAGYCPSPVSGQGTSLALVGAYILAGCIASYPDYREAFRHYEEHMRPFVDKSQKLPPGVPWIVNPQSAWGISVLNTVLWIAGAATNSGIASTLGKIGQMAPSFVKQEPQLPSFPALHLEEGERKR